MIKHATKILVLYSVLVSVLYLKLISEQSQTNNSNSATPFTNKAPKEIVKKEIVYKDRILEKSTSRNDPESSSKKLENFEQQEELLDLPENPELAEQEEQKRGKFHDTNSEKMLAFFEQAVGIDFTPEQEQKALSALRAYDEADVTAMADADTALLDRKLKLKPEQKENIRKAITEFISEPDEVDEKLANTEVKQIDNQNQAYFNQVAPFLNAKQRSDFQEMINQGVTFVDE